MLSFVDATRTTFRLSSLVAGVALGAVAALSLVLGWGVWLVAGVAVLMTLVVTATRPVAAMGLVIAGVPLFSTFAFASVSGMPDITAGRVLILWCLVVVGYAACLQRQASGWTVLEKSVPIVLRHMLPAWVGIFLALMLIAAMRSPVLVTGLQNWLDQYFLPLALLIVATRYRWSQRQSTSLVAIYLACCCLWSLLALYEFLTRVSLFAPNGILPWASGGVPFGRTGGPFINPAFLGTVVGIGLVLAWIWSARSARLGRLAVISIPICAIGLIASLTRASWLGAIAGLAIATGLARKRRMGIVMTAVVGLLVGVVALVAVFGAGFLESRTTSTSEVFNRVVVQRAALNEIVDNPLLGLGSERFGIETRDKLQNVGSISAAFGATVNVPHNTVLSVTVDGGLAAGAALVVIVGLLAVAGWNRRAEDGSHELGLATLGAIAVFVVNAMFIDMQFGPKVTTIALPIVGVLLASSPRDEAAP